MIKCVMLFISSTQDLGMDGNFFQAQGPHCLFLILTMSCRNFPALYAWLCHQHLRTVSKPLGIACPASSIRDMSISVQREEARVREGYGLCTLSEHGAPSQESCTVTVEKPGGRARLTPFLTFLGPRPCSPLTHRVLPLPQYPVHHSL